MVNHLDAGSTAPIDTTFVEVVENELLVGYELAQGFPGIEDGTRLTMSIGLTAEGDGTRLELRQGPFPEQMRDRAALGWTQAMYKLDGLLATPIEFRTAPRDEETPA